MNKVLIVVDAQVDFTTGRLGSEQAAKTVRKLQEFLQEHKGDYRLVLATLDTHRKSEFKDEATVEGRVVPPHCIVASSGCALAGELAELVDAVQEKSTFMADDFSALDFAEDVVIDVCGFCTDICVVSNALFLRREFPDRKIRVIADLCAGTSEARHRSALDVMSSCLIDVVTADEVAKEGGVVNDTRFDKVHPA